MHKVTGKNSYCGPFAIAALTGRTTDDVAALVRSFTGRRYIKWMCTSDVERALRRLGRTVRTTRFGKAPTLNQWINKYAKPDTSYVVLVTGHFIVVRNNRYACSVHRTPVRLDDAPGKRRRVQGYIEILDEHAIL